MTTVTETVTYTDVFEPNSSFVEDVYYDAPGKRLYLDLANGTRVGYADVLSSTFAALKHSPSVGSFYNRYIKNHFKGVNGDVELVPVRKQTIAEINDAAASEPVASEPVASEAPSDPNPNIGTEYIVNFTVRRVISAGSVSEAVAKANLPLDAGNVNVYTK